MKLKTLKDFEDKECYCDFPSQIVKGQSLKKRRFIPEDELKAEAVKWVKEWEYQRDIGNLRPNQVRLTIYTFIEFFNLTDEDLE